MGREVGGRERKDGVVKVIFRKVLGNENLLYMMEKPPFFLIKSNQIKSKI